MKRFVLWFLASAICIAGLAALWWSFPRVVEPIKPEVDPRYQGVASVFVRDDTAFYVSGHSLLSEIMAQQLRMSAYNIKGSPAIDQLIIDLDLKVGLAHDEDGELTESGRSALEELKRTLSDAITVTQTTDASQLSVIWIRVIHTDAALASRIANRLADNYLRKLRTEVEQTLSDMKVFFEHEQNRFQLAAAQVTGKLLRAHMETGSIDISDPVVIHDRLTTAKDQREKLLTEQQLIDAQMNSLRKWHDEQPDFIVNDDGKGNIEESPNVDKLDAAKELATLKSRYSQLHRDIAGLDVMITPLEEVYRNYFPIRRERDRMNRELKRIMKQLEHWEERAFAADTATTLLLNAEKVVRSSVVQRSPEKALPYEPESQP